jgi:hypothetical protein
MAKNCFTKVPKYSTRKRRITFLTNGALNNWRCAYS